MDLEVLALGKQWRGFGTKIIEVREYLKSLEGYTHFIFVDAYDVLFLKDINHINNVYDGHFKDSIVFSAEKNCWPNSDLKDKYPENESRWKYLNSGSYMAPIDKFLKLVSRFHVSYSDDDQLYFTKIFLETGEIVLDYRCFLFQTYSFVAEDDFDIDYDFGLLINEISLSFPSIIHGNGKTDLSKVKQLMNHIGTLQEAIVNWDNTVVGQEKFNKEFTDRVNNVPKLKAHRDWTEQNIWGFGERSFLWMWWLIVQEMPRDFTFIEIGVFRGAILSVVRMIADMQGKNVKRYGITPLSSAEIGWESDYRADIERMHDQFEISKAYTIIDRDSKDPVAISSCNTLMPDILYIDGCHTTECVKSDIINCSTGIKVGGYLVIDDAACKFPMPFGYFQGIQTVCDAVDELLPPFGQNDQYEHLFNIVHNRIWKKVK